MLQVDMGNKTRYDAFTLFDIGNTLFICINRYLVKVSFQIIGILSQRFNWLSIKNNLCNYNFNL